jgi:hypothetical protein
MLMLLLAVATSSAVPPTVHRDAAFAVKKQPGVPYGQGVLCKAKPCVACEAGMKSNGPVRRGTFSLRLHDAPAVAALALAGHLYCYTGTSRDH